MQSHRELKLLEKHFLDFKYYYIKDQFGDIYHYLYTGYKRGDRVLLSRSLS